MADNETVERLLNTCRGEIMVKRPKSLSIWQGGCTLVLASVGRARLPLTGAFSV